MRQTTDPVRLASKQRALRIPLDYVRAWDPIGAWKWLLSMLILVAACGFAAWEFIHHGPVAASPGQLARAHAAWESNCSACHLDFLPLRDDGVGIANWFHRTGHDKDPLAARALIDRKCEACHPSAIHHGNQISGEVPTCASCHRDHRGVTARLADVSDFQCLRCHRELTAHGGGPKSRFEPPIAEVQAGGLHPEFRSLATDPGNVKFNHDLHLKLGIPAFDPASQGKRLVTLATLLPEHVERYRRDDQVAGTRTDADFAVQLDCGSCHEDDSQASASPTSENPLRGTGEHLRPVEFERHCQACHPLRFAPATTQHLPHGLAPLQIREFLFGHFAQAQSAAKIDAADRAIPRRPIPGRGTRDSDHDVERGIVDDVLAAERFLTETRSCCKCHMEAPRDPDADSTLPRTVLPAMIPSVWFRFGRFDHRAHRQTSCKECHREAYGTADEGRVAKLVSSCEEDAGGGPGDQRSVMIAGRDQCAKCHSPAATPGAVGSARFDCVECHRYHGGTAREPRVK